jgi:Holliday junction resolvase RusA-like endonuclease
MNGVLHIPIPPSANDLWRSGRRRVYRSARYEAWAIEAGWLLVMQHPAKIVGPYELHVTVPAVDPETGSDADRG